jgi:nucleoside-diphosphate kinase
MITNAGFKIISLKLTQLTADAQAFYSVHAARPFYGIRIYVKRRYCCCYFRKDNAVEDFRTLIGATNPADAAEGTIRKAYATSIGENAVHGSDSDENAAIEGAFPFCRKRVLILSTLLF